MASNVLAVRGLHAGYGAMEILHDLHLDVHDDEIVVIIGPNGAGKSTLLKAVFGLADTTSGTVHLRGKDITGARPEDLVALGVGYVPQIDNVFPTLTVEENLEMGMHGKTGPWDDVYALFPVLKEKRRERAGRLSGGQRQMLAMGRALMAEPKVLLLDEPSAGMAPNLVDDVFRNVQAVAKGGVPVLLVEQNARRALAVADRGYVFDTGKNRHEGTGKELLDNPDVAKMYLGG